MSRRRHPDRHVEDALRYAEQQGWRIELLSPRAHGWGKMYCPHNDPGCRCGEYCVTVVWGTPRRPEDHARQLRRVVDGCVRGASTSRGEQED
jgi:hypothetical protein